VLGFALTLAARRPRPFGSVRGVAWWGTVLIGTLWSLGAAHEHAPLVAGFVLLVWGAVHLEMAISAPAEDQSGRGFWRRALISIGSTTWTAVLGAVAANWSVGGWTPSGWMVTGAMFVGACGLAHLLSGSLGWLMDRPRTERHRMGAVLWLESGALLIATVATGIDGSAEVVCWLGLGVAGVIAARWIGARPLAVYGVVLLSIAISRIVLWESWNGGVGRVVLGIFMNRWTALAVAGAVAMGGCATMLRVRAWAPAWRSVADACVIAACALAFVAAVHQRSDPLSVAVWGAVVCAATWGLAGWLRSAPIGVLAGLGTMSALLLCAGRQLAGIERDRVEVVLGLAIGPWSVVIALVAAVWGLGAWICAMSRPRWLAETVVASAIGGALALMLIPDLPICRPGPLVVWWALIAVLLMAAHAIWTRTLPAAVSLAALAASAASWVVLYPLNGWNASNAPVLLHPGLWIAVLLTGLACGSAWWLRREGGDPEVTKVRSAVIAAGVGGLLFAATSLEVARAAKTIFASDRTSQNAAVSIWWGVFAAVLLGIGFASRVPIVRHLGLGLLGIATAKAVLIDLSEVSPEWRVVSFIGLGLLMLGVAVGYAKLSRHLESGRLASEGTEGAA
jgi:hypothetical protein